MDNEDTKPKILGKICPHCGTPGLVVLESKIKIIYECANGHAYETIKRMERG
jgi:ssDNA-binding Zn-finger/Zn-ribbon topoisomerase 1